MVRWYSRRWEATLQLDWETRRSTSSEYWYSTVVCRKLRLPSSIHWSFLVRLCSDPSRVIDFTHLSNTWSSCFSLPNGSKVLGSDGSTFRGPHFVSSFRVLVVVLHLGLPSPFKKGVTTPGRLTVRGSRRRGLEGRQSLYFPCVYK